MYISEDIEIIFVLSHVADPLKWPYQTTKATYNSFLELQVFSTEKSRVKAVPFNLLKCTVVLNVLCKRNQCVAEVYPAWPIWSRDLTLSTQSTSPFLTCLGTGDSGYY
jgi:hypothetical protein